MNSLAFKLFLLTGVELIIYTSLLLWNSVTLTFAIPFAILMILAVRTFLVILSFIIAWIYRSPAPPALQLSFGQMVKLVWTEWWAFLATNLIMQPLEPWLIARQPSATTDHNEIPVILVHGLNCNGGYWWPMYRFLQKQGITQLFTLNMEPIFDDIEHFAQQLARRVEEVCAISQTDQVILVGHSMGGLVSRVYYHRYGGKKRIAKIITLGSPHHGSILAWLLWGRNLQQMRPNDPWLNELNQLEQQVGALPLTSIYSYHDNLVAPQESSVLPSAKNIPTSGIGHLSMTFSPVFQQWVYREIKNHQTQ
jgi:triacylglycerol esterase/lipase EstA (alpha/beta hydrolase family)